MSAPSPLSALLIQNQLATAPHAGTFITRVVFYPQVGSTNDVTRQLGDDGAAEGALVVADEQSAGRGRLARRWYAPPRGALLFSLLFRPTFAPAQVLRLVMACSVAASEAIESETGLRPGIKWPNDLLLGERKLAGLLAELGLRGQQLEYVVIGLGLNVNFDPEQLEGDFPHGVTSLQAALGRPVDRLALLAEILERIAVRYAGLRAGDAIVPDWRARLVTLGRRVSVAQPDHQYAGLAEATDEDGALLVRQDDGELVRVQAGDVTLRTAGLP